MSDELIEQLVLDLEAVKRLASPARRFVRFVGLSLVAMTVTVGLVGIRADLAVRLRDGHYLVETGLLLLLFSGATLAALRSGVPGARLGSASWLVVLASSGWLLSVAAHHGILGSGGGSWSGLSCLWRTLLLCALPAWGLFAMLRRSAPLEPGASGLLTMISAGALAVLGTRVLCAKDGAAHVLAWHIAPLALLAFWGWCVGRVWLSPNRL